MDQKDKKGDFSIKSTFQSWLDIEGQENVTFLFGNTAVGKTTVCQLIKKIIDNDPHPNLKLIQKKKDWQYECEGEINPKSIKPLTIYPKKYHIKSQNMSIIEVPSRIYSLQKKRPYIDKILNTVGFTYSANRGSFIFAVDAKNTSGKCQPWKKTFHGVFENFNIDLMNEKTFKSVGFLVISKSTSNDADKNAFLNRIEDLQKLFDEQKRKSQYIKMLKTIQKQKNLSSFRRTTQNQEIIQKDIVKVFQFMKKLSKCSIPLQKQLDENYQMISMETVMLEKQEENHFDKFNQVLNIICSFFSKFFQALFVNQQPMNILNYAQKGKSLTKENNYLKKIWPADLNLELKQQKVARNKLQQLRKISAKNKLFYQHTLGKASILLKYKQKIQLSNDFHNKTLTRFLQILAEHGLIEQSCPQLSQLQSLYLELIQYAIFQQRFGPFIKNINYKKMLIDKNVTKQFTDIFPKMMKMKIHQDFINNKISLNITSQQARKYLSIIEKFFHSQEITEDFQKSISLLKKSLVLLTFDRSDPKKAISQIDILLHKIIYEDKVLQQIEKNKDNPSSQLLKQIQFLNSLALQVAKTLQDCGRPDLCAQIFQDCGNFHSAIKCYQVKLKNKKTLQTSNLQETKEIINIYLQLLMNLSLYQKALEQCYQLAQMYKPLLLDINKKRKLIKERRLLPDDQQNEKKFQQRFLQNSSKLSSFYSNKHLLDKIKQIAQKNRK